MRNNNLLGISNTEAKKRLKLFGLNELTVRIKTTTLKKLINQFKDINVLILLGAAFISITVCFYNNHLDELTEAYVLLGIVILNGMIGFIQEYKSEKALEALERLVSPRSRVIRAGKECLIDAKDLVPGDIMILSEGDKISADSLLIDDNELKSEESALTGESVPVHKTSYKKLDISSSLCRLSNPIYKNFGTIDNEYKLFTGTIISSGSAKALVIRTGMDTSFGQIANLTATTEKDQSPLQKELKSIGYFVGKLTFIISSILFLVGIIFQGQSIVNSLMFAVAVAVAAVPEGLPATVTIALAIGVQKMAKKNAIIKQLSSVETLGSTTVICSDKTGTLTQNQMTVRKAYLPTGYTLSFNGTGYNPKGEIHIVNHNQKPRLNKSHPILPSLKSVNTIQETYIKDIHKMMGIITHCNDAKLVRNGETWSILGDPTEGALLTAASKSGIDTNNIRKLKDFPFDSIRKRMSTIIHTKQKGYELYVKGAPDSIIEKCTHILKNDKIHKITTKDIKDIIENNNSMAESALRVLGVAYKPLVKDKLEDKESLENALVFVGLIGMIDPPRPEVKEAVNMCHKAGIRTIIITGDYGKTALAIAKDLKIVTNKNAKVITGKELDELKKQELKKILKDNKEIIFARVSPEHKLIIVDILKDLGEIVAVTGDGVNDAPALKRADIGVSMGITGTDVSKEAANMVLTDDSFASIVEAIKEGRTIYKNLRKFVWYIFSCNIGELITVFSAILLKIPAPLTAVLILAIDLGTDVLPALALGLDPDEPGIMNNRPRDPAERIMIKPFVLRFVYMGSIIGVIVVSTYIFDLFNSGWRWGEPVLDNVHLHASTLAFVLLVIIQMVNAFNARSEIYSVFRLKTNYYLWGAVTVSFTLVLGFINIPIIQDLIGSISLSIKELIILFIISLIVVFIEEIRKLMIARKKKS